MTEHKDRTRLRLGIAAALTVGMIVFCALRLRVTTDIMHFFPAGTDHRLAELSRKLADSSLTRTLILDVGGVFRESEGGRRRVATPWRPTPGAWLDGAPARARGSLVQLTRAAPTFVSTSETKYRHASDRRSRRRPLPKGAVSSTLRDGLALAPADRCNGSAILRRFERRAPGAEVDGDQFVTPEQPTRLSFSHPPLGPRQRGAGPLLAEIRRQSTRSPRAGEAWRCRQAGWRDRRRRRAADDGDRRDLGAATAAGWLVLVVMLAR